MTRVWLTRWEWSCCGDPFRVGDDVDFGIQRRTPSEQRKHSLAGWLVDVDERSTMAAFDG